MANKLQDKILAAIKNSPDVKAGNYISVVVKSGMLGFGKQQIELSGRTASEKDKAKIEEIAKEAAGGIDIISTLRVSRTG